MKTNNIVNTKDKSINISMNTLRTISAIMVILLHINAEHIVSMASGGEGALTSLIIMFISTTTRIAVALFVMISGKYVIESVKNYRTEEFYKKRIPRLIIPLVFWSLVYFVISFIFIPETTVLGLLKDFVTGYAAGGIAVHIWYLYMLIPLYLMAPYLYKKFKDLSFKKGLQLGIFLALFGSIVELIKNATGYSIWIFWWLEFLGLFILGYILREYRIKKNKAMTLVFAFLIQVISAIVSSVLIIGGSIWGMVFHWGVFPTIILTTVLVFLYFNSVEMKENFCSRVSKYALGIYLFHPILLVTVCRMFTIPLSILDIVVKVALTFGLSLVAIIGLSKIKIINKAVM